MTNPIEPMKAETVDLPIEMIDYILNFLDFTDLANCRLVNSQFESLISTKTMNNFLIQLHHYGGLKSVLTLKRKCGFTTPETHRLTLEQIKMMLRANPQKNIWIEALETDLRAPDVHELFTEFGSFVYHFSCKSMTHNSSLPATYLLNLVRSNFVNLNSLTLAPAIFSAWEEALQDHQPNGPHHPYRVDLPLRHLKTLRFCTPNYFMIERSYKPIPWPLIVQKMVLNINHDFAPNLENVYGVRDCFLNEPEMMAKIHLIKSISYNDDQSLFFCDRNQISFSRKFYNVLYGEEETLKNMAKFSNQKFLKLNELQLCISVFSYAKFRQIRALYGQTFTKILNKTGKTLKKLDIQPLEYFGYIDFPRLENLTSLTFHDLQPFSEGSAFHRHHGHGSHHGFDSLFFPIGFNVREKLPSVTSVEIAVHISDSPYQKPMKKFHEYFPSHIFPTQSSTTRHGGPSKMMMMMTRDLEDYTVFPKVRYLKLSKYQPRCCVEKLSKIFPNVVSLSLDLGLEPLIDILPICFSSSIWPELEELFMTIYIFENCYEYHSLDTVITGISRSKLNDILVHNWFDGTVEDIERWRVGPGISKLENLKRLKFIVKPESSCGSCRIPVYLPVMSHLSGKYGFGQMMRLDVTVECHESCSRFQKEGIRRMFDNLIHTFLTFI